MGFFPFAPPGARRPSTLVVAASNASPVWKTGSDYVCAGTNDDVTINAAMAALPAQGGTIVLSDGTFTIGHALIPTINNTTLRGQGMNATNIVAAVGANCNGYQFDVSQAVSLIFCSIQNLTFNGNYNSGSGNTSGFGCHINYNLTFTFWDFYLRDVWFNNWAQDGFYATAGHGYVLDHVLGEFCGGNGCNFPGGGFNDSPPRIVNGSFKLNGAAGLTVSVIDALIQGNDITANSGPYGLIMSASGCKAVGNQIRSNTNTGVHITGGSEGHQFEANSVSGNGQYGLLLDDAFCTITGNFFSDNSFSASNTYDEINIAHGTFNAQGNQITDNVIDCASQSRYGINFAHVGDTGSAAVGNRIINAVTAPINQVATDTILLNPGNGLQQNYFVQPGNAAIPGGHIWSGSGAPNITASIAGDLYLRTDTPAVANQRLYMATAANTWAGVV